MSNLSLKQSAARHAAKVAAAEQARCVAVAKRNAAAFVSEAEADARVAERAEAVRRNLFVALSPWRFYDMAVEATAKLDLEAARLKGNADRAFDAATDGASLKAATDLARAAANCAKDARSARAEENALYDAARYEAAQARVARKSFR